MNENRRQFLKQSGLIGLGLELSMISAHAEEESSANPIPDKTKLCYHSNGQFKIVQFTDIHWQWGDEKDTQTAKLMGEILDLERPDLVVLTGDSISGKELKTAGAYESAYSNLTRPIVERGIPWGAVFGNHDDEGCLSRKDQMTLMRNIPYCLAQPGPADIDGVGNYTLCLYDASGSHVNNVLYLIDSLGYAPKDIEGYAWISRKQINWFVQQAKAFEKQHGEKFPSLVFFHIPIPEYHQAFDEKISGVKQEDVCCSKINSGFFAALLEAGAAGTFVGHDHVNDYDGKLFGIRLCYGRCTGFNTYGKEGFSRGARVILLKEGESEFQTWIRAADH
jgi:hypothetical protein